MARKVSEYKIDTDGRDKGKVFVITEMSAVQAEKWAMRAILAAARSGVDIGDASRMGMQGVAMIGIGALLNMSWVDAEPLIDEMMDCVKIKEASGARDIMGDDIEEIATRFLLRKAIMELHVDFSTAGNQSK